MLIYQMNFQQIIKILTKNIKNISKYGRTFMIIYICRKIKINLEKIKMGTAITIYMETIIKIYEQLF